MDSLSHFCLMSLRKLYYAIPPAWRFAARRLYFLPSDTLDALTGKRDALTPPKGLIFTGGGDFRKHGRQLVERLQQQGLQPQHRVLDIGSGIGRLAVALTGYLQPPGAYEGFDVVEMGVRWCRQKISSRFPHFRFQYIPLKNDLYRSDGADAAHFAFPYPDNHFDFAVANSVFTHMLPDETRHYLSEINRVLKPGGKLYATFFLLTPESEAWMAQHPEFAFPVDKGDYRLMDDKVQAANIAYKPEAITPTDGDLRPTTVQPGFWAGAPSPEYQDVVWMTKITPTN